MTQLNTIRKLFLSDIWVSVDELELEELEPWIRKTYIYAHQIFRRLLETPVHDFEPSLNMDKEIEEALRLVNGLQEFIWEKLNIGHWKDVPLVWRKLYSYVTLLKVTTFAGKGTASIQELLKICDNGLLMGYPICHNMLAKMAHQLHLLHPPGSNYAVASITQNSIDSLELEKDYWLHKTISLPGLQLAVPSEEMPSLEQFSTKYFKREKPVLLNGIMRHWPAMGKWTPDFIVKCVGSRTVPVEIGSKYTDEDWTQKLITVEEFVHTYMQSDSKDVGYVAQHQLFDQMPELREDIRVPEYCYLGRNEDIEVNAWFGPAGTLTPTHYDPNHNLLAQVFGTKFVRLFPPSESKYLYPNSQDSLLFNTSQVDLESSEALKFFPNLRFATYADVLLSPGSVLYIPPNWWHMVRSLTPSFSVSFWFESNI